MTSLSRNPSDDNLLVIKIGGGQGLDLTYCATDIAQIAAHRPVVVVHGLSAALNALCAERGVPVRTITSPQGHTSRYTDPATRDLYIEAAERVNASCQEALIASGLSTVGMGSRYRIISGIRKSAIRAVVDGRVRIVRDDYTGSIEQVDIRALRHVLAQGAIPVVPPLAHSPDGWLNIDGDRAAAAIAGALGAAELIILSNVRGLYRRFPSEDSLVRRVLPHERQQALEWAGGRMKRKVLGALEALEADVSRVRIADGRCVAPVSAALGGQGTEFVS